MKCKHGKASRSDAYRVYFIKNIYRDKRTVIGFWLHFDTVKDGFAIKPSTPVGLPVFFGKGLRKVDAIDAKRQQYWKAWQLLIERLESADSNLIA